MNPTRSMRDFPILQMDQISTLSIAPDWIAPDQRQLTWPAILTLFHRCWTIGENVGDRPSTLGGDLAKLAYLLIRRERTIRT